MHTKAHIRRAIEYIARAQAKDGSFSSRSFFDIKKQSGAQVRTSTFHASLIALALAEYRTIPEARAIALRALRFLTRERSPEWTWNYWHSRSPEWRDIRVPDDLDDTALALAAIAAWRPEAIGGRALARITKTLIGAETATGGPYNTWLVSGYRGTPWEDTDLGVNANIGRFLTAKDISLPGLNAYIEQAIAKREYRSKYYGPIALMYAVSAWCQGPMTKTLIAHLAKAKPANVLMSALAASALLRLGERPARVKHLIAAIKKAQRKDGSWPAEAFFVEQIIGKRPLYSGSEALTAAYCLEALALFDRARTRESEERAQKIVQRKAEQIAARALRRFTAVPELGSALGALVKKTLAKDVKHEIALLPHHFALSLDPKHRPKQTIVDELCVANILGWTGYTIADKILDGEPMRHLLPGGNIAIREVSLAYRRLLPEREYRKIETMLDTIDKANFWEHRACALGRTDGMIALPEQLPGYGDLSALAEKSIGHAAGPIAIMLLSGKDGGRKARLVERFFTQYIIARQLNDDAHDWLEDMESGFLNSASVRLFGKKDGLRRIDLAREKEALEKQFWTSVIDGVASDIFMHVKKARRILATMAFVKDKTYLESLLAPLERAAQKAIRERDTSREFLEAYKEK